MISRLLDWAVLKIFPKHDIIEMNALTMLFFNGVKHSLEEAGSAYLNSQANANMLTRISQQLSSGR